MNRNQTTILCALESMPSEHIFYTEFVKNERVFDTSFNEKLKNLSHRQNRVRNHPDFLIMLREFLLNSNVVTSNEVWVLTPGTIHDKTLVTEVGLHQICSQYSDFKASGLHNEEELEAKLQKNVDKNWGNVVDAYRSSVAIRTGYAIDQVTNLSRLAELEPSIIRAHISAMGTVLFGESLFGLPLQSAYGELEQVQASLFEQMQADVKSALMKTPLLAAIASKSMEDYYTFYSNQ